VAERVATQAAVGKGSSAALRRGAVTVEVLLTVLRVMALGVMGFGAGTLLILCDLPPTLCVRECSVRRV